jgi:hypothetical protein
MDYISRRNWLPDNKHSQKIELCVKVILVIHLRVTPTGMLWIHKRIFILSAEVAIQNDSGGKTNILSSDGIGHCEKNIHTNNV